MVRRVFGRSAFEVADAENGARPLTAIALQAKRIG
jgi:hypothetical protein